MSTDALNLNGGTINNSVGNAATLTLPVPGKEFSLESKAIVIDGVTPSVPQNLTAASETATSITYPVMQTQNQIWPLIVSLEAILQTQMLLLALLVQGLRSTLRIT